jgi:nucleotide-binding universal stress UspA family protein
LARITIGAQPDARRRRKREPPAIERILIAVDGSPEAWFAADIGIDLAAAKDAAVTFIHASTDTYERVVEHDPLVPNRLEDLAAAEPVLGEALARARAAGIDTNLELSRGSSTEHITAEILGLAQEIEADMVVAGSRGRGAVVSSVLGSVSRALLRAAPVATLIVKVPDVRPSRADKTE